MSLDFGLTSMPMTSGLKVFPLADGPAEAVRVPEDVPILGHVLIDGPVRGPVNSFAGDHVLAVAVGIGGP